MGLFSDILLTVDYDRTLTAPDSTIPQRNVEAIRYFIENDGAFTINTGRSLPMIAVARDIVPVNAPLLLYNGSAAYDTKEEKLTFCHTISMGLGETVRRCMELYPDLTLEVQGLKAHYVFRENPLWEEFCKKSQCPYSIASADDDLGPFLKFTLFGEFREATVDELFSATPEALARFDYVEADLRRRFGDNVEVFRSAPRVIDIHTKGVSKARSARQLQRQLGRKLLVCAGDAENDLPMLWEADFAFTPADGVIAGSFPNVCPCAQGAVADVIYEKIPEILKSSS